MNSDGGRDTPPQGPDEENFNHHQRNVLLDAPLCPCTTTTEGDAFLMCLALGMRHNFSWKAIVDILKLINVLFSREVIHASKYYLTKFFDAGEDSAVIHMYCSKCEVNLGTKALVQEQLILQCNNCGEPVKDFGVSSSYFVSMKMKDQFKNFMQLPGVSQEVMTYLFQRTKVNNEALEDIFDGDYYRSFFENEGPLSCPKNLSVIINTDGMSLGMSTLQAAWPIFLSVCELSPKNRKKHLIFAGIWVSKKQPNMRVFLKPFVDSMTELFTVGFNWINEQGEEQTSKVFPLLALLDSGARYKFINLSSYTSYYGCTFCYQRAENTNRGRRFTVVPEAAPLRTHESMCRDMMVAHENRNHRDLKKRVYKGCKGVTPLILLHPYLNLGQSVVVDYLHNALLGVTRSHIYLDLRVTSGKKFYIGEPAKLHTINQRLLLIRPPKSITRTPRDLKEMKTWRAHEWRSFLLHYGLVCMDGVMNRQNLEHFGMLSAAFYILLQKSISTDDLQLAERYLVQYVYFTQQHYGKTAMTYNVHLLLHVISAVQKFGPLFAQNMFVFEGENRHLGQMLTSPGRVPLQLTRRYLMCSAFPSFCEMYASTEAPLEFIEEITGKRLHNYLRCGETVLMGTGKASVLNNADLICLAQAGIQPVDNNIQSFSKLLHKGIRFTTDAYSEGKKNDDSWLKTNTGLRGRIEKIYHLGTREGQIVCIFIREVLIDRNAWLRTRHVTVSHIKIIPGLGNLKAIQPTNIIGQCINMDLDNGHFIVDIPYGCYGD